MRPKIKKEYKQEKTFIGNKKKKKE
jgi:hypothetical protein